MSTKTLRKRIALVAVSALGAGLLSIAPANAAEISAPTNGIVLFSGSTCSVTDLTGSTSLLTAAGTEADASPYETGAAAGRIVTMPVGGSLSVFLDASDILQLKGSSLAAGNLKQANAGFTAELTATTSVNTDGNTVITADSTDMYVTVNAVAVGTTTLVAGTTATATASDTNKIVVKVVASCTTGTWSDAYSSYETSSSTAFGQSRVPTDGGADSSPDGEAGSTYVYSDADTAVISLVGKNGYNAALPTGTWIVSATNGAVVSIATSATAPGVTSTASVSAAGTNIYAEVAQATSGTALNTVVTISYNGANVYTKSILFQGDLAKITVSGADVQATGGSTIKQIYDVNAYDAAGNLLIWELSPDATRYTSVVTSASAGFTILDGSGALDTTNDNTADTTTAYWTCGPTSGKASLRLKGTTNAGTTVYSNDFDAACGGSVDTFTASLDKPSYVPGDIATLTITAKDASGHAPKKTATVDEGGNAAPAIAGSQLTAINSPLAADTFDSSGVKKYTFTVGSTAGKYNVAVNLGYTTVAVSVPYSVATTGEVSNAQVLAAIVKLIASINKQIAALQKALKK